MGLYRYGCLLKHYLNSTCSVCPKEIHNVSKYFTNTLLKNRHQHKTPAPIKATNRSCGTQKKPTDKQRKPTHTNEVL